MSATEYGFLVIPTDFEYRNFPRLVDKLKASKERQTQRKKKVKLKADVKVYAQDS